MIDYLIPILSIYVIQFFYSTIILFMDLCEEEPEGRFFTTKKSVFLAYIPFYCFYSVGKKIGRILLDLIEHIKQLK